MHAEAGGAPGSGDRGAGGHQVLDVSFPDAFAEYFIGSGNDNQPGVGCDMLSLQDVCGGRDGRRACDG